MLTYGLNGTTESIRVDHDHDEPLLRIASATPGRQPADGDESSRTMVRLEDGAVC